jgi:hypothetical protein
VRVRKLFFFQTFLLATRGLNYNSSNEGDRMGLLGGMKSPEVGKENTQEGKRENPMTNELTGKSRYLPQI